MTAPPPRPPRAFPSPAITHVAPFVVFMGFLALKGFFKDADQYPPGTPWYLAQAEHWIYPLQTLSCLALLAWWWPTYPIHRLKASTVALAIAVGALGIAWWIAPSILYQRWDVASWGAPSWWQWKWLGLAPRGSDGFNPTLWQDQPVLFAAAVALRFLRMGLAVPLLEELFWRSFLWRSASDPYRDFWLAPLGQWSARALATTVPLFALAHQPVDWLGAIGWALLVSAVLVRTKSLGACILTHATSNLLLGWYVMETQQWGFW